MESWETVLSLCRHPKRKDSAHGFYLTLGFEGYEYPRDNGLSQTHFSFQLEVHRKKELWVSPKKQAMSFFLLRRGQLKLQDRRIVPNPECDG